MLMWLTSLLVLLGCSQQSKQPSEVEQQAAAILNQTFAGDSEYWFAVDTVAGKPRLTQLHRPRMSLQPVPISETDRMNGVTDRAVLSVHCSQYRWFDGKWSEWKAGTGENALVSTLMGNLLADWGVRLEKKNGQWTTQPSATIAHHFQSDHALLARMMSQTPR